MKTLTQVPVGTQVFFGNAAKHRRRVEKLIYTVLKRWNYQEIIPPIFDYYDVFSRGMGSESEATLYRFFDREGNLLALRPEFTSLIAKTVATRLLDWPKPLKLCYSGDVFRYEAPRGGRQREFFQLGIENIGGKKVSCDAEVIQIAMESLQRIGIKEFQFNLGEMGFFSGLIKKIGISTVDLKHIKNLMELKDSIGLAGRMKQLNLSTKNKNVLYSLLNLTGKSKVISSARHLVTNEQSMIALENLESLYNKLKRQKLSKHLTIDLSGVRGLDYYTGIVFKIYVPGSGFEVGSGGRYDNLLKNFGCDLPSVGFTFYLERLMPFFLK